MIILELGKSLTVMIRLSNIDDYNFLNYKFRKVMFCSNKMQNKATCIDSIKYGKYCYDSVCFYKFDIKSELKFCIIKKSVLSNVLYLQRHNNIGEIEYIDYSRIYGILLLTNTKNDFLKFILKN